MRLRGKVALVTGGGTGIGRETSLALAREGAAVAINYSRSDRDALATAEAVRELGVRAITVKADVSRDEEACRMVEAVSAELGGLDILVNNAGTTTFIDMADLDAVQEKHWDEVLSTNLKGAFFCSRAASRIMKARGSGTIINIASIAGIIGLGSSIPYCASKAGVISLTRSLARVLAPAIRVNAIAPGFVDTRWTEGQDRYRQANIAATPMGRVARPEDIAEVVAALATGFEFVTGQVIVVDGGKTLG